MKLKPKTLQHPTKGLLHSTLRQRLAEAKAAKDKKEEEERLSKELAPPPAALLEVKKEEAQEAKEEEESDDSDAVEPAVSAKPQVLQSDVMRLGQAKKKPKAKAKAKAKGKDVISTEWQD